METLYFKFVKPLYWKEGVGLDLVAFKDEECTNDLFRWPEFCADKFPPKSQKGIFFGGKLYEIVWMK